MSRAGFAPRRVSDGAHPVGDQRILELVPVFGQELAERAGRTPVANPTTRYLSAVDGAGNDDMQRFATIYADCGSEYFAMVQKLMLEERPAWVEKHREVLEKFAGEVVALGYAP